MQRRRQTKRLINGQNMSFPRAMQNFVDFNLLLRNNKKNICAKVKNSESTVLVLLGGWISVISTLEGRIGLNHKCLFPGQPVSKTAFRSLTNTTIPVDLFSG